jgi:hypothetical protein
MSAQPGRYDNDIAEAVLAVKRLADAAERIADHLDKQPQLPFASIPAGKQPALGGFTCQSCFAWVANGSAHFCPLLTGAA